MRIDRFPSHTDAFTNKYNEFEPIKNKSQSFNERAFTVKSSLNRAKPFKRQNAGSFFENEPFPFSSISNPSLENNEGIRRKAQNERSSTLVKRDQEQVAIRSLEIQRLRIQRERERKQRLVRAEQEIELQRIKEVQREANLRKIARAKEEILALQSKRKIERGDKESASACEGGAVGKKEGLSDRNERERVKEREAGGRGQGGGNSDNNNNDSSNPFARDKSKKQKKAKQR